MADLWPILRPAGELLHSAGYSGTGRRGDWWVFEVDQPWSQFSVNAFVQSGMTNSIPDLLSPDAAQWLFLNPGPSEPIVLESFGGEFQGSARWVVRNNFPNLYGLNLVSVQALDWGNSNATPVTSIQGT